MISNLETQRENLVDADEEVRDAKKITIDNTSSIIIHRFVWRDMNDDDDDDEIGREWLFIVDDDDDDDDDDWYLLIWSYCP